MTDATPRQTAAEWAAAVLATMPRLTDEQWSRVNATLGVTTTDRLATRTSRHGDAGRPPGVAA